MNLSCAQLRLATRQHFARSTTGFVVQSRNASSVFRGHTLRNSIRPTSCTIPSTVGIRAFSLWGWGKSPAKSDEAAPEPTPLEEVTAVQPSESTSPEPVSTDAVVPEPTTVAEATTVSADSITESIGDIASSIPPPPLHYGELAELGLVTWSPAGFFTWALESVQVTSGLPWWATIIVTTIAARTLLLPLVLRGMRATARLAPVQPEMAKIREQVNEARKSGDTLMMQTAMMKQQKILREVGVNPFDTLFMSVAQLMVQLGFFIGLRRMCALPVEQLKYGGFGYLTDLTASDPYFITPILSTALINAQLTISGRDMAAVGSPAGPHLINGFRLLSILGVGFMAYLPAAINIHIITSICFVGLQTLILRLPAVRARLALPPLPKVTTKQPTMRETFEHVKAWVKNRQAQAEADHQERLRKMRAMKK